MLVVSEADLVYEVEGHGSLTCDHIFGFEILKVLVTDVVNTQLQLPGHLVFLPVLLSLCRTERKETRWKTSGADKREQQGAGRGRENSEKGG